MPKGSLRLPLAQVDQMTTLAVVTGTETIAAGPEAKLSDSSGWRDVDNQVWTLASTLR